MIILFEGLTKRSAKECAVVLRKLGIEFDIQGRRNTFSILLIDNNERANALEQLKAGGFSPDFSSNEPVELEYREGITSLPNVRGNQSILESRSPQYKIYFRNTAYIFVGLTIALCGLVTFSTEHYLSLPVAEQIRIKLKIPSTLWPLMNDIMVGYKEIKLIIHSK
jgi:hypothetical protein